MFSTFAYTGNGAGGLEDELSPGMLAYTDDALLYLNSFPESLVGTRVVRTANSDQGYWANDYIVATAGRDLEVIIAHDPKGPMPGWLNYYQAAKGSVKINGHTLSLHTHQLKNGDVLRIPGNADQGMAVKKRRNLIIFARPK